MSKTEATSRSSGWPVQSGAEGLGGRAPSDAAAGLAVRASEPVDRIESQRQSKAASIDAPHRQPQLQKPALTTSERARTEDALDLDSLTRDDRLGWLELVDLAGALAGIVDPTPASDGVSAAAALARGDGYGAMLSVGSMAPYLGDAVLKPLKLGRLFPALGRLASDPGRLGDLLHTLKALGKSAADPRKVGDTLSALNRMQESAAEAYKNGKWLERARELRLPSDGPIPFVPPKRWNAANPQRTSDGKGFVDGFGNEWRKGPSRTPGEPFEWDVIPRSNALGSLSRDGTHLNVSLGGTVTHR